MLVYGDFYVCVVERSEDRVVLIFFFDAYFSLILWRYKIIREKNLKILLCHVIKSKTTLGWIADFGLIVSAIHKIKFNVKVLVFLKSLYLLLQQCLCLYQLRSSRIIDLVWIQICLRSFRHLFLNWIDLFHAFFSHFFGHFFDFLNYSFVHIDTLNGDCQVQVYQTEGEQMDGWFVHIEFYIFIDYVRYNRVLFLVFHEYLRPGLHFDRVVFIEIQFQELPHLQMNQGRESF